MFVARKAIWPICRSRRPARCPGAAHTHAATITSRPASKEIADTRARGYAIDRAEHVLSSSCLAAPIFDANNRPVGAIGISGRDLEPLIKHQELVRQTAEIISHHLL